jgi:16S rRNA (cytosine967-C5)-methyltransferase
MSNKRSGRKHTAREVALDVLVRVEKDRSFSNLVLHEALESAKLEPVDVGLVTELVYGTIQRQLTLDWMLGRFIKQGIGKLDAWVRGLLRMSVYQMRYLDRIPEHAAVHEAVEIAKRRGHAGISGMVNGVLRNVIRQASELDPSQETDPIRRISLQHSHPEWMVARWIDLLGIEETEALCQMNNTPPKISLRANSLRLSRDRLLDSMKAQGWEAKASEVHPSGIVVHHVGNVAASRWFQDGFCTIQDESSMLVATLLSPMSGTSVLDCCAAPGGKTTHLAEIMKNEGDVKAADIHPHKIELIRSNAERLGTSIVKPTATDARQLHEAFREGPGFDYVLLDAPCSGLGVIRRKPDIKWTKKEGDIREIAHLQRDMLRSAAEVVKPGGVLVYSTCTLDPEENENQVRGFIAEDRRFELDREASRLLPDAVVQASELPEEPGMFRVLPHRLGSDGFFMARLVKRSQ